MAERNGAQKMEQVTPEQIQGILINPFYAIWELSILTYIRSY